MKTNNSSKNEKSVSANSQVTKTESGSTGNSTNKSGDLSSSAGNSKGEKKSTTQNKSNTNVSKKEKSKGDNNKGNTQKTSNVNKQSSPTKKKKGSVYEKDIKKLTTITKQPTVAFQYITSLEVEKLYRDLLEEKEVAWNTVPTSTWRKDMYTLYICLNTWCAMFEDVTTNSGSALADQLRLNGITQTINDALEVRKAFLSESSDPAEIADFTTESAFWNTIIVPAKDFLFAIRDIFIQGRTAKSIDKKLKDCIQGHGNLLRNMNTLLGFPRRLSLNALVPVLRDQKFSSFIDGNDEMSRINYGRDEDYLSRYIYGNSISRKFYAHPETENGCLFPVDIEKEISPSEWDAKHPMIPEFVAERLSDFMFAIFKDYKQDTSLFTLPPGRTYEGFSTYFEKFEQCIKNQQWLREHGVNFPVLSSSELKDPEDCCRLVAVPKTYKEPRLVAPEPVARQVLGYQVASGMRKCLKKVGIDITDQTKNRDIAMFAVIEGFSTIDWTAASDSIALTVARRLLRQLPQLLADLEACRSNFIQIDDKKYKNHRLATMGNSTTFPFESGLFGVVAGVAVDWALRVKKPELYQAIRQQCHNDIEYMLYILENYVIVYGDDTAVPDWAYEYLLVIAQFLGLKLNVEKSYTLGQAYRESCGAEFMTFKRTKGKTEFVVPFDIEGVYWPRGLSNVALAELVSMQHKCITNGFHNADRFLKSCILDVFPDITYSEVGSYYDDIWTMSVLNKTKGYSPYGHVLCSVLIYAEPGWIFGKRLPREGKSSFAKNTFLLIPDTLKEFKIPDKSSIKLTARDKVQIPEKKKLVPYCIVTSQKIAKLFTQYFTYTCVVPERFWTYDELGLPYPHDENMEVHTTISCQSSAKKMTDDQARKVDYLAYLMSLGGGIEHVNSSEWTKDVNKIINRIDLVVPRQVQIKNKKYPR